MNISINNTSGVSLYEQIYEQIKNAVLSGELNSGDALPTIRSLAKDLRISVITTSRAYDELEKDGFIYSVVGKGSFVTAKGGGKALEEHLRKMEEYLAKAAKLAAYCDVDENTFITAARNALGSDNEK